MNITFNPELNFDHYRENYTIDKRLKVDQVLPFEAAAHISNHLDINTVFTNAYFDQGQYKTITNEELTALSPEKRQSFVRSLYTEASQGRGFYYGRHNILKTEPSNSLLKQVLDWLNSENTLKIAKEMTGIDDIVAASAQATRYMPGQFLTRHNDVHDSEKRRVAYVLNFSQDWHPDWGGLLQFYQNDGTPRDAWTPTFNSMSLFDVNHVHAVTYVAHYALKPRLAITGWFRAKPL